MIECAIHVASVDLKYLFALTLQLQDKRDNSGVHSQKLRDQQQAASDQVKVNDI